MNEDEDKFGKLVSEHVLKIMMDDSFTSTVFNVYQSVGL